MDSTTGAVWYKDNVYFYRYRKYHCKIRSSHYHILIKGLTIHCNTVFKLVWCSGSDQCYQRETSGEDYMGDVNVSSNGIVCQRWDSRYPVSHNYVTFPDGGRTLAGNRCRNPGRASSRPWCYNSIPGASIRRLDCDIPACTGTRALYHFDAIANL